MRWPSATTASAAARPLGSPATSHAASILACTAPTTGVAARNRRAKSRYPSASQWNGHRLFRSWKYSHDVAPAAPGRSTPSNAGSRFDRSTSDIAVGDDDTRDTAEL